MSYAPRIVSRDQVLAAIVAAGPLGITRQTLAARFDVHPSAISSHIAKIGCEGDSPIRRIGVGIYAYRTGPAEPAPTDCRGQPKKTAQNRRALAEGKTERHCMCCRNKFLSDGPHHRMCSNCRSKSKTPFDY